MPHERIASRQHSQREEVYPEANAIGKVDGPRLSDVPAGTVTSEIASALDDLESELYRLTAQVTATNERLIGAVPQTTEGVAETLEKQPTLHTIRDRAYWLLRAVCVLREEVDRAEAAEKRLAEVEAERDAFQEAWQKQVDEVLNEHSRAEAAEAMLPRAYRAGVEASKERCVAVRDTDQCCSGTEYDKGHREAAYWCCDEIEGLPTPTSAEIMAAVSLDVVRQLRHV